MQQVSDALTEVKDLFQKVTGQPAPEIAPQFFAAFPPGVDPATHVRQEVDYLERLVDLAAHAPTQVAWIPQVDCFVADDAFVIRVEVPGMSRKDLEVFVVGGECVVRGERKAAEGVEKMRPITLERPYGRFERRFVLPAGSDPDRLSARYLDGVLDLRIGIDQKGLLEETRVEVA
jgi:HSP20 family protein